MQPDGALWLSNQVGLMTRFMFIRMGRYKSGKMMIE
ncbi:hypothetical protein OG2516_07143 [Oceanicola granulosus HTCC2516]|uniref:Uncharacterized protein n=1 Tax=Oceanicola granulosus (strain ATCC BAA-861 / DSM 15982 / KCTC 12143 / HTCC2516) TaxID=314256 RepID=Q2CCD1_OCEGH|nr:hypothetical protein OG2516_07143 [Oceanicola granulosus HTCC2516]